MSAFAQPGFLAQPASSSYVVDDDDGGARDAFGAARRPDMRAALLARVEDELDASVPAFLGILDMAPGSFGAMIA